MFCKKIKTIKTQNLSSIKFKKSLDFLSNLWYCWSYQSTGGNKMILQALKNMYPKVSEKVHKAVMKDLE